MTDHTPTDAPVTDAAVLLPQAPPPPPARSPLEQAANDIAREVRAAVQESNVAVEGRTVAPPAVIDAIRGQIANETEMIERLTSRLVPGMSDASVAAITSQLEGSQERLTSLQEQLDRALGTSEASVLVQSAPPPPYPTDVPPGVQDLATTFFVTVAVIAIGVPIVRAIARRMDRRTAGAAQGSPASNVEPRLDRIEQAIEAVAIEVERISEGQRYTNKIMSEVRALPSPNPLEQWPAAEVKEPVPAKRQGER